MERVVSNKITIIPLWENRSEDAHVIAKVFLNFSDSSSIYSIQLKAPLPDKKYTPLTFERKSLIDDESCSLTRLKATASQISSLSLEIQGYSYVPDKTITIFSEHPYHLKELRGITFSHLKEPLPGSKYYLILSSPIDGEVYAEFKKIPERSP